MELGALGKHKASAQLHVVQLESNNSPEHVLVHFLVVEIVLVLPQRADHATESVVQVKQIFKCCNCYTQSFLYKMCLFLSLSLIHI